MSRLPPTTDTLFDEDARPYFLWWTEATVGDFKEHLRADDPEERAYWMGALLREANTRDVWAFVSSAQIRALWPYLVRYLGASRDMWAWLLGLPKPQWPPVGQASAPAIKGPGVTIGPSSVGTDACTENRSAVATEGTLATCSVAASARERSVGAASFESPIVCRHELAKEEMDSKSDFSW